MPHPHSQPRPTLSPSHRPRKPRRQFGDPIAARKERPDFVQPPLINRVNLNLPLRAIMPEDWITDAGHIVFHTVGDTGGIYGTEAQEAIADQMEAQVDAAPDQSKPAFFYNLGDVVYFNGQSQHYRWQFYEPYQYYQPHIFAIPGNHDGDSRLSGNDNPVTEPTLTGFITNFCDEQPRYLFPYRATTTQPYVYWTLEAPFVTIVGLYSNVDGALDGRGSIEQQRWLEDQLRMAPEHKCLIVAVHHPPYSLDQPHGGSPDILIALDEARANSHRTPDIVLSGHVHSYQRFTRQVDEREIPFLVAGAGGFANMPQAMYKLQVEDDGRSIETPFQTTEADVILESYNDIDPGFLQVTIDRETLVGEYFTVPFEDKPPSDPFDRFSLDWRNHKIS